MLQVTLPWAEAGSRFTHLFEALAIDVLLAANVKRPAAILRITWDEAWHLMERAVLRGRAAKGDRLPKQIGVDEKAIAKGHRYMTLVCDLEQATVEYIGEEREKQVLAPTLKPSRSERRAIEAISLDMWPAYINACRDKGAEADGKMVFDRFHIMRQCVEAVDKVRKQEHKALMDKGDTTLAKSKYLWLTNPANMTDKAKARFKELKSERAQDRPCVGAQGSAAGAVELHVAGLGRKFWKRWYFWATHSRLRAHDRGGKADCAALAECVDLFQASHRVKVAMISRCRTSLAVLAGALLNSPGDNNPGANTYHARRLPLLPPQRHGWPRRTDQRPARRAVRRRARVHGCGRHRARRGLHDRARARA